MLSLCNRVDSRNAIDRHCIASCFAQVAYFLIGYTLGVDRLDSEPTLRSNQLPGPVSMPSRLRESDPVAEV